MADITKQAYEEFRIHADFGLNMESGVETLAIASCTIVCEDKDGNDVTATLLDATTMVVIDANAVDDPDSPGSGVPNSALQVLIKGGTEAASNYKYTFKGVTDLDPPNKWELDLTLRVRER